MSETPFTPVVTNDPVEVADGVFVIPDGRVPLVPNIGIVRGTRATLVVDAGMGPRNGEIVRRHADRIAAGQPLFLTLTHFHPEHGFGAQVFADTTIVYNSEQLADLRKKGDTFLTNFRGFGEHVAAQLEGVELVEPHVVYEGSAEIGLGDRNAELRTFGRAHTRGDQVVFIPEQRVLFCGDLVESQCFAIFPWFPPNDTDVDGDRWIAVLEQLEQLEPAVVVPGHGELGDTSVIATAREYIEQLRDQTRGLKASGATEDDVVAELDRSMRERHPDWAQPEWIAFGARHFYAT